VTVPVLQRTISRFALHAALRPGHRATSRDYTTSNKSAGASSRLKIAMLVGRTGRKFLLLKAGSTKPSANCARGLTISAKAQAEELADLAHVADRVDAVEPREGGDPCPPVGTRREDVIDADDLLSEMEAHDTALLAAAARLDCGASMMRLPTLRTALGGMNSRQDFLS
jgi:hypothetical protein